MCRLIAVRSLRPACPRWHLLDAPHALVRQSCDDREGECHPHGWGIAAYAEGSPQLVKAATAAAEDTRFSTAATETRSTTVLAHVRQASVGSVAVENSHPFSWGSWTFAHNGTVEGFEQVAPRLEAEAGPQWWRLRQGTTDSEAVFVWLLARLERAGVPLGAEIRNVECLADVVADCVLTLDRWSAEFPNPEPSRLNFVLTDGVSMVATRWRHSLWWLSSGGKSLHPKSSDASPPHEDAVAEQVVVASEPTDASGWQELPQHSILAIDARLSAALRQLP